MKHAFLLLIALALGFLLGLAIETHGSAKTAGVIATVASLTCFGVIATVASLTCFGAIAWFRFRVVEGRPR